MNKAIKLFELEPQDNTRRFSSQMFIGRNVADFILEDNKMYNWKATQFIQFLEPYEIVTNKNIVQEL